MPNAVTAILSILSGIREAVKLAEDIGKITDGENRDLTPEELEFFKTRYTSSWDDLKAVLRDRGIN